MRNATLALVSVFCLSACAVEVGEAEPSSQSNIAAHEQAITAESSAAGYRPVPATRLPTGRVSSAWDGPMADLLAADALAQCWSALPKEVRLPETQTYVPSFARATTFADTMVTGLLSKMDSATCSTYRTAGFGPATPTSSVIDGWISARRDPACSFQLSSGLGLGLELAEQRDTMAHAPMPAGVPLAASQDALAEVAYADLYTCMAQKLVEHTQSSFVFLASAEEVLRLYDWARNRSLLAVLQRSLIARFVGSGNWQRHQPWRGDLTQTFRYGGALALRAWLQSLSVERQTAMGQDFALSVDTLVTLLNKQAEMLLRDASREGRRSTSGARGRLLRALYGDNVLVPNEITQDMSGIEIGVLMALGRASDALDLELQTDNQSHVSVDIASSADRLLTAVERMARAQSCAAGDTNAPCAQVGPAERTEDFAVRSKFGIHPEHAETLVRALAESLFGAPQDASAATWQWAPTEAVASSASPPKVESLQSGRYHSCALYDNGSVACWGLNHLRQLGDGLATHTQCSGYDCALTPVWVRVADGSPLRNVTSIAVGDNHACAAREDNSVWCWGDVVGRADATNPLYASPAAGLPVAAGRPARIFAGGQQTCAVVPDPSGSGSYSHLTSLYCWGDGSYGQLGDGTRGGTCSVDSDCGPASYCSAGICAATTAFTARKVAGTGSPDIVAMSGQHVCVAHHFGPVSCWGRDDAGQLGSVTGAAQTCVSSTACRTKPTRLTIELPRAFYPPDSLKNTVAIYAGGRRTCALGGRGDLKCWGELSAISTSVASDNSCGAVACLRTPTPVRLADGTELPAVYAASVAQTHACARAESGYYCWGQNHNGAFGNGTLTDQVRATSVGNGDLRDLTAGFLFTCGISTSNAASVRCAGWNAYGQLGQLASTVPVRSSVLVNVPPPGPLPAAVSTPNAVEVVSSAIRRSRPGFVFAGAMLRQGAGGASVLHLGADAAFGSYTGEELQVGAMLRHMPLASASLQQPLSAQGFMHRRFLPNPNGFSGGLSGFEWGGVQALALAREALKITEPDYTVDVDTAFAASARAALPVIEAAIGARAVIIRPEIAQNTRLCRPWAVGPREVIDGACVEPVSIWHPNSVPILYSIFTNDEADGEAIAYGRRVPHPIEQSLQPVDFVFGAPPLQQGLSTSFQFWDENVTPGLDILEGSTTPAASSMFWKRTAGPTTSYQAVFDGELPKTTLAEPFAFLTGAVATYGGSLNGLATQAFAFDPRDWSKPQYDAFGLPTDWVPSADPALTGSNGEEPYQYYLRLAKETAQQATQAINDAFETTRQEETDEAALEAANERAATLRKQETELLCGSAPCKPLVWEEHQILEGIAMTCAAAENEGQGHHCDVQMSALQWALGDQIRVPALVWSQLDWVTPQFRDYEGGEMTQSLTGMWTALRRTRAAAETAVRAIHRSNAEYRAGVAEWVAADYAVENARSNVAQTFAAMQAQVAQMQQQIDELEARQSAASAIKRRACSDEALKMAFESGKSYGDVWSMERRENGEFNCRECNGLSDADFDFDNDRDSFSKAPLYAQVEACKRAVTELKAADAAAEADNLQRLRAALKAIKAANPDPERQYVLATVEEAVWRMNAAEKRLDVLKLASEESLVSNLNLVLDATGSLSTAAAELSRARKRSVTANARYSLDQSLDSKEISVRQGLRRRYQGFAQWRASAMAENARRTAVAARRAIESRLVVNLGRMGTEEPFVAPPSLWADDVYERDLKPPAAVGITVSGPEGPTGQYASKLTDYVNNLELFVAGYSIKRPTAVARNDAEVLSLAGPSSISRSDVADTSYRFTDPDSAGWELYCENTGTYVVNPLANQFGELDYDALRTACDGEAPSRAVIRFWLDPWGQLMGNPYSEPFDARYNTRWKQFAVNLVGTGIRDCSAADVPIDCYAEPFLRYDLRHVGPAVVTDHDMAWRSLKIPNAVVQGAKALAIEEWVDSVSRGWNVPDVQAVARGELMGRPMGGTYELSFDLTPDVRLERIERVQILTSVDYWTRQE